MRTHEKTTCQANSGYGDRGRDADDGIESGGVQGMAMEQVSP